MRKISLLMLLTLSCFILLSCNYGKQKAKVESNTEQAATLDKQWAKNFLDTTNAGFSKQLAAGDSIGLADRYWPDAELLLDYSEPVKGTDMVHAWGETIRMGIKELNLSTTDITGTANFIIETGTYEMKDGAKALLDKGKYVVVWEKRNGIWKLYRDIGSTSLPAAK